MALDNYLASEIALDCADGLFSRREAVRRLMLMGLTAPAAAALLASCGRDDDAAESTTTGSTAPPVAVAATDTAAPSEDRTTTEQTASSPTEPVDDAVTVDSGALSALSPRRSSSPVLEVR